MISLPKRLTSSMVVLFTLASAAWGQDAVQYRLGLGGTYVPIPLVQDQLLGVTVQQRPLGPEYRYVHGNEANGQTFDPAKTPIIRWDAVVAVTGNNYGAANLVSDLAVRNGSVDGPIVTDAVFSGDYPDGAAANFSIGVSISTGRWAAIIDAVGDGGTNMALFTRGVAVPGQLLGIGAGYINWNSPQLVRAGVGVAAVAGAMPNGSAGLGQNPTFDGKIDISRLTPGTYYLVLSQGTGVNVLKPELNPSQAAGSFAKAADLRPTASISFVISGTTTPPDGSTDNPPPSGDGTNSGSQDGTSTGSTDGGSQDGSTQTGGTDGSDTQGSSDGQSSTDTTSPRVRPFAFCGSGTAGTIISTLLGLLAVPYLRRRTAGSQRSPRP